MKTKLITLLALVFALAIQAQTYELTLIQNSGYNYSVAAVPDFNSTAPHPYINDQNFTITIPDNITISNVTGGYSVPVFTSIDAFNPGEDAIAFNLVQDIVLPAHTAGTPIVLTTFDVNGSPTTGSISLLDNTSALAMAAPNIFNAFFIGTLSGDLMDSATDNYMGQTGTTSYNFATLGTVENEITGYSIFPNPAKDIVQILVPNTITNFKIEIYDVLGKQVFLDLSEENTIDVSNISSGLYLISIIVDKSKIIKRLIVD
ncbi:T9SS type A sorting domain-containing protein [uncultured Lacinutrix sp.]|uniref:T9SS type A sorting domain-containing protein n=1 Tax=uncultured Lacinutrix sp. TaxID=574032 RepID=UPI00262330FB|nr:T9SS type A sorting domain-containing protein [uncultured Lacinutrix sp.]